MNRIRVIGIVSMLALVVAGAAPADAQTQYPQRPRRTAQVTNQAYQIGYDAGYRKGYEKGDDDVQHGKTRNPTDFKEYRRADDGFSDRMGSRDEYRLGYRAGFDAGYGDAVSGQGSATRPSAARVTLPFPIPTGRSGNDRQVLKRGRGGSIPPPVLGRNPDPYGYPNGNSRKANRGNYPGGNYPGSSYPGGNYPNPNAGAYPGGQRVRFNESLVIELETELSTRNSREGDRFFARVVDPSPYYGARVEGYIGKLDKPGRVAGKAEIVLVFQRIIWPDGYGEPMQAQVEEVLGYSGGYAGTNGPYGRYPSNRRDNGDIDAEAGDEGQIKGKGSKGRDTAIVSGSTAVGATIGGILGGSGGAAVGAAIGAVTGGTVVAANRGHHIDLEPGAQLRIRTGQGVRP